MPAERALMSDFADTAPGPVLTQVDALAAEGRHRQAIELLTAALRVRRSPELARRAVQLRHRSFVAPATSAPFTPPTARPLPEPGALPSIHAGELDATRLREGLATHGCLLVRNLISTDRAAGLACGIDRALAGFDAAKATDTDEAPDELAGWYSHFTPDPGRYRVGGRRNWVRATGAMWTADSPFMFAELIDLVDETGVGAVVTEYLGERPALSANKCTLRRVPLTTNVGWHQDGAFLGEQTRTVNLWLALGHCGRTAPGMDIVPRRFDHVIETGTGDAIFDWSVGTEIVRERAGEAGVLRPEFGPGDALLFDHLFLHSTCVEPTMTSERHAMETWFFAPSAYPEGQIPLTY